MNGEQKIMYQEIVNTLERAIFDLLTSKKESILDHLRNTDFDAKFYVISFDVNPHDAFTPLSISFGTRKDSDNYINTVADWKYYYLCRSDQIESVNISNAISAIQHLCTIDDDSSMQRENLVFFAAAQALLSKRVWKIYNSWQISAYNEIRSALKDKGKNLNPVDWHIKQASKEEPILHCIVTNGDLSAEANYCEMIKAIRLLNDYSDEVIDSILRNL